MKKTGFTIVELIIAVGLMAILTVTLIFVYLACFRVWDSGQNRSSLRTKLSQAMELMSEDLRQANTIDSLTDNSVSFFGENSVQYNFYLYNATDSEEEGSYDLLRSLASEPAGDGAVMATGIQSTGTPAFSRNNGLITIDLTSTNSGETVHMRTKVKLRNISSQ
ncbi:MAG: hypothetical protein HQL24_04440 [Candidatus Omnitrophica bacterium]|nr:hypothetical protein [Candidatus Omnitrophota bacterium]